MNTALKIKFLGLELSALQVGEVVYVPITPLCHVLGLCPSGQNSRIHRTATLAAAARLFKTTGTDGKTRQMLFLPVEHLYGWLMGVEVERLRPELCKRMTGYQRACRAALAREGGAA